MESKQTGISVPSVIMTPADVSRLRREIRALDNYLEQQALRAQGPAQLTLPRTTRVLDELATANKLNLLDKNIRSQLLAFLNDVAKNAPVVHISFASDPSAAFMQKLVVWFRKNIHPAMLIRIGLQPNIAAGCVVQTTNKYFDLSLRQTLKAHQPDLLAAIKMGERTRRIRKPRHRHPRLTRRMLPATAPTSVTSWRAAIPSAKLLASTSS